MEQYTLPKLVFDIGSREGAAVVSPGGTSLSRDELKKISLETGDAILSRTRPGAALIDGSRVVSLALPNGIPFVLAFLGVTARGAIAAPLNPAYTVPEFEFYLKDSKASVLVLDVSSADESYPGFVAARNLGVPVCSLAVEKSDEAEPLKPAVEPLASEKVNGGDHALDSPASESEQRVPTADTLALILHTSGTTGKPKAVPLSHSNLCYSALNVADAYALGPEDRGYLIQVLFHIHGIVASLLAPLVSGGSVVVPNKFDANATWAEFADLKCSWLSGTPSALQMLLHAPKAGPDLGIKFLRSCSSPLLPSTFKELQSLFKCPILEAYAMTENAHQMTTNAPEDSQPGFVGKAAGTVRLAIYGDDASTGPLGADTQGEVCITGPSVTRGYLENPAANEKAFFTERDGMRWFRTGDVGVLDNAGRLRIVGRKSEIINRGGEKISPPEVDEALMLCAAPHVREAACFAVPDAFFGQEVEAAVALAAGAPAELRDEAEIQRRLEKRLAAFKVPKRVHFFDGGIPKGPTGKIQRGQLAKRLAGSEERNGGEQTTDAAAAADDDDKLCERIAASIAEDLRVDATAVRPEVTLLELGADSINLTRLLASMRRLGCGVTMKDVMLNPSVRLFMDICIKSRAARRKSAGGGGGDDTAALMDEEPPAPFSLLEEQLGAAAAVAGGSSPPPLVGAALAEFAKQTGLEVDQIEDAVPLSPEAKLALSYSVTDRIGLMDTSQGWLTSGGPIQSSVDIDRLKWAFAEADKVEPLPRSFLAQVPGSGEYVQIIAKPGVVALNWKQISASSEQEAHDKLQEAHDAYRHTPGCRLLTYRLLEWPGENGETGRAFYLEESHIFSDNIARGMLRDNVAKLYLGQATVDDLPQKPLSPALQTRHLQRSASENYDSKVRFWTNDEKGHGSGTVPPFLPPPETGIRRTTLWTVNAPMTPMMWHGDLKGLSLSMGLTAPTLVMSVFPLAMAAMQYQGTRRTPASVDFSYTVSTRDRSVRSSEQLRGLGIYFMPYRTLLAVAERSLGLHLQQSAVRLADQDAHRYLPDAGDRCTDCETFFSWREVPAGSPWSKAFEAGPELFAYEVQYIASVLVMRLGVDTLLLLDGDRDEFVRWRTAQGFPLSIKQVLARCLTFLAEHKDNLASLTLADLMQGVWPPEESRG